MSTLVVLSWYQYCKWLQPALVAKHCYLMSLFTCEERNPVGELSSLKETSFFPITFGADNGSISCTPTWVSTCSKNHQKKRQLKMSHPKNSIKTLQTVATNEWLWKWGKAGSPYCGHLQLHIRIGNCFIQCASAKNLEDCHVKFQDRIWDAKVKRGQSIDSYSL